MISHYSFLLSWLILISAVTKLILCCGQSSLFTYRNGYSESGCLWDQKPVPVYVCKCACVIHIGRENWFGLWTYFSLEIQEKKKKEGKMGHALVLFCFIFLPSLSFLSVASNIHFDRWECWQRTFTAPWGMVTVLQSLEMFFGTEVFWRERDTFFFFKFVCICDGFTTHGMWDLPPKGVLPCLLRMWK